MARRRGNAVFSLFAFQDIITSVTGIMILVTLVLALELLNRKIGSPAVQTAEVSAAIREELENSEEMQHQVAENEDTIDRIRAALSSGEQDLREAAPFDIRRIEEQVHDLQHVNDHLQNENKELVAKRKKAERRQQQARTLADEHKNDDKTTDDLKRQIEETKKELARLKSSNAVIYNPASGDAKAAWLVEVTARRIAVGPIDRSSPGRRFNGVAEFKAWAVTRDRNKEYFVLLVKPDGIADFQQLQAQLRGLGFDTGYDLLSRDQSAVETAAGGGPP